MSTCTPYNTETQYWEYYKEVGEEQAEKMRRDSSEFTAPKTRPLVEKLEVLLEIIITTHLRNFGKDNVGSLIREMDTFSASIGGEKRKGARKISRGAATPSPGPRSSSNLR